jgi:hypothetical protein
VCVKQPVYAVHVMSIMNIITWGMGGGEETRLTFRTTLLAEMS